MRLSSGVPALRSAISFWIAIARKRAVVELVVIEELPVGRAGVSAPRHQGAQILDDEDSAGDHVRRFGHSRLAGIAREPAQAVHSPDRRPLAKRAAVISGFHEDVPMKVITRRSLIVSGA